MKLRLVEIRDDSPDQPEITIQQFDPVKLKIGRVPVMIRSQFCNLAQLNKDQRAKDTQDCLFDQGGYFIVNGNEKVIVA